LLWGALAAIQVEETSDWAPGVSVRTLKKVWVPQQIDATCAGKALLFWKRDHAPEGQQYQSTITNALHAAVTARHAVKYPGDAPDSVAASKATLDAMTAAGMFNPTSGNWIDGFSASANGDGCNAKDPATWCAGRSALC